ncbi:MAG: ROK family protein [Spirochaetes bacterium]|nr:ROK family protein [Spirochaetota bacterium]
MIKPIKNTAEIRNLNKKAIVEYLKNNLPAAKKEVAFNLNQSFATTSNLCNQLINDGFIKKKSATNSSGGRIPELFMINEEIKHSIGLNLTQKGFFEIALINLNNKIILKNTISVKEDESIDIIIKEIKTGLAEILESSNIDLTDILGMSVAVPGIYDVKNDVLISENFPVFNGLNILRLLNNSLNIPVYIENDSNLLALASSRNVKSEKENLNLIFLFMLEGIGAGIISEGRLLKGFNGFAAEISELPSGMICKNSDSGIIEKVLSLSGIISEYNRQSGKNLPLTMEGWNSFTVELNQDDINAKKIFNDVVLSLSGLLSALINIFDPEVIFLGGILEKCFDAIMTDLSACLTVPSYRNKNDIRIEKGGYYDNLIFKGCGELIFNRFSFLD